MRKIVFFGALALLAALGPLAAQTRLNHFSPTGQALFKGSDLNLIVDSVNNLQGTGTPSAVTGTTGTFSGAVSGTTGTFSGAVSTAALASSGPVTNTGTTSGSGLTQATYYQSGAPAATDQVFFIATRAYRVVAISQIHSVAAGGASVLQVTKDLTTAAPGAGTDLLTNNTNTGFDLNATANTVQVGTLVATTGVTTLAAGDRLSVDYANTIQSSAGVVVTVSLAPL